MNPRKFFAELKRRNVFKVAAAYTASSWLLMQITTQVSALFEISHWVVRLLIVVLALGFPVALLLTWMFELTPDGIKRSDKVQPGGSIPRKSGRKWIITLGVAGTLAFGLLLFQLTRPKPVVVAPGFSAPSVGAPAAETLSSKSIAVLPFQNLSKDEENAFFTNGVQDEILTTLAKVADLKVISRTSVMQFRDPEKRNLREIAQALNVAHVLEGSVQRSANRVRVTAQLIDARSDTHLWAERYDRELADVFAIQTEIAQKIAGELQAVLSPREKNAIQAKPTSNVAAYEFYLRGTEFDRILVGTESRAAATKQLSLFEQAVALDPQFVAAWCMVARIHLAFYWFNHDHTESRLGAANEAISRAAALQPEAAEVRVARAFERYWGHRDYAGASAELEKARQFLPNDADVLSTLGLVERRAGRWNEAVRHLEAALALDPRNGATVRNLRDTYSVLRRYDEAARVLDQALRWRPHEFGFAWPRATDEVFSTANLQRMRDVLSSPAIQTAGTERLTEARLALAFYERDYGRARDIVAGFDGATITAFGFVTPRQWYEGRAAAGLGDHTAAAAAFRSAREAAAEAVGARPDDAKALIILAQIDARLGRKESAIEEAERARALLPVEKDAFDGPHIDWLAAGVYAQVGELERALDLLEQVLQRPRGIAYGTLRLSDEWDPLRDHPQFDKFLKSLAPKEPK